MNDVSLKISKQGSTVQEMTTKLNHKSIVNITATNDYFHYRFLQNLKILNHRIFGTLALKTDLTKKKIRIVIAD